EVYTTRPDTLFGATYMVIAPEHPMIDANKDKIANYDEVIAYRNTAAAKSDFERTELVKEKTGVKIDGICGINPVNDKEIPIFVSDYVLMSYGTGAIMAVPAHDTRDYEFAKVFDLPIIQVVAGGDISEEAFTDVATGIMENSGFLNGLSVEEAKKKIIEFLQEKGKGEPKTNYKLRDWVFSRQRYWGEPIPIVHCPKCGPVAIPEEQLPLLLPDVESYEPTDNGESPLAAMESFVNTTCPVCGAAAKRETDTMPQWAGSSWYFLRYMDPHNSDALASEEALEYWGPVDWYNGGMEHTTLHLLYSRFWHKFLYDIGVVKTAEPYAKRTSHGMILGEGGEKMSKSRGNVVNPDDIVRDYGADTLRTYEMFIGDFEKSAPWNTASIKGCKRFLEKTYNLLEMMVEGDEISKDLERSFHLTIKKVGDDIEHLKMNTALAALMSLINEITAKGSITRKELEIFVKMVYPFAPHLGEEMWETAGFEGDMTYVPWPQYDEAKTKASEVEIAVQVLGKIKGRVMIPAEAEQDAVLEIVRADEKIGALLEGKSIVKVIYVKGKLINLIIK
ncbi:MAG: leucine--tRNA ligase, partial [Clostridia bacterium]|nr:leucine--tRNA ligase [Clostridia bacterium]